jgi:replicative DNA helicase
MNEDFYGDPILLEKFTELTSDIHKTYDEGTCVCFAGAHGRGKQLALDTELPTPDGFIKLSELKEGDRLFDENGNVCNVTALHPINISPESYEVEFDDGVKIKACADHKWSTLSLAERRGEKNGPSVRTTKELIKTLRVGGVQQIANHSIPCSKPLKYSEKKLPISPYVLGAWLGDGTSADGSITSADKQIVDEIEKEGYLTSVRSSTVNNASKASVYRVGALMPYKRGLCIGRLRQELDNLNLLNNKHIPEEYMRGSFEQRLSLVQGLMDTDGTCDKSGKAEFCSVLPGLAKQLCELLLSFGIKANVTRHKSAINGRHYKDRYRIACTTQLPIFRLKRKLDRLRLEKTQLNRTTHRYIVDIRPISSVPMRCITVDSPSHLFLVTRSCIATHNSMTVTNVLKKASVTGYQCLYTTLDDIVSMAVNGPHDQKFKARKELTMVDFLVIDEFDPRHMKAGASADLFGRQLENVFRRRAESNLPTFMCTNSPQVLDSFDGALRESIASLMHFMTIVTVLGKDARDPKNRK